MRLQRPVKIIWSREESIIGHHKRHPTIIRAKWGATRDGKLVAAEAEVYRRRRGVCLHVDQGDGQRELDGDRALCRSRTSKSTRMPCIRTISPAARSADLAGRRARLRQKSQMNKLAEALGMDPVELRAKNVLKDGAITAVGTPLPPGVTLDRVLTDGAVQSGYWRKRPTGNGSSSPRSQPADPAKRRGIGMAMGFKNVGFSLWRAGEQLGNYRAYGTSRNRACRGAAGRAQMWARARIRCLCRWRPRRRAVRMRQGRVDRPRYRRNQQFGQFVRVAYDVHGRQRDQGCGGDGARESGTTKSARPL